MIPGINLTYEQLVVGFPPRPIASDEQYWATVAQIDILVDKGDLTADEQDYLTALGMMVERYEAKREPDIELRGLELIRVLMEEQRLRQRDLVKPVFKTDSIASDVLRGKRRLTVEHIDKLAQYFQLPHELFFEPVEQVLEEVATGVPEPISLPPKMQPSAFVDFIEIDLNDKWRQTPPSKQNAILSFQQNKKRLRKAQV